MRQKQRGVTFLGLVVVAGILVFGGIVGMQVFPTYIEFLAVQKAAKMMGIVARQSTSTDLMTLSIGMILGFLIGMIAWGVKSALTSGIFEALLYDELAALDRRTGAAFRCPSRGRRRRRC